MGKHDSKDKKTINAYLDREVVDAFSDQYSGITSRILNNLCKKFLEMAETDPALLKHVLDNKFSIVHRSREK